MKGIIFCIIVLTLQSCQHYKFYDPGENQVPYPFYPAPTVHKFFDGESESMLRAKAFEQAQNPPPKKKNKK